MSSDHIQYRLLRELSRAPSSSQRSLANQLGVSVGKVNYCIRALIDKGCLKVSNFRRSDRKLAYTYLLTPKGASEKLRITRDFLSRKEREYDALHGEIEALRYELMSPAQPQERHNPRS